MPQESCTPSCTRLQFLKSRPPTHLNLGALPQKTEACNGFYIFIFKDFLLLDVYRWEVLIFPPGRHFLGNSGPEEVAGCVGAHVSPSEWGRHARWGPWKCRDTSPGRQAPSGASAHLYSQEQNKNPHAEHDFKPIIIISNSKCAAGERGRKGVKLPLLCKS